MLFRATLDGKVYEIEIEGHQARINGEPVTFSYHALRPGYVSLLLNHRSFTLVLRPLEDGMVEVTLGSHTRRVRVQDERALLLERFGAGQQADVAEKELRAPMPGKVLKIFVSPGEVVEAGDRLLILEAMKMENEIRAPLPARIEEVHVEAGEAVSKDQRLITFGPHG